MSSSHPASRPRAVTLQQAAQEAPTLARLAELARESRRRLDSVEALVPAALRPLVQPGPIDGSQWCLLVKGNAAAAKLRQLLPALQAHLQDRGCEVTAIRLKVQSAER